MFGSVGGGEILLLMVLALLLFGPRKLPKIGRTIGTALAEFRKATTDFRSNLEREVDLSDLREARQDISESVREAKGIARGALLGASPNRTSRATSPTGAADGEGAPVDRPAAEPAAPAPRSEKVEEAPAEESPARDGGEATNDRQS